MLACVRGWVGGGLSFRCDAIRYFTPVTICISLCVITESISLFLRQMCDNISNQGRWVLLSKEKFSLRVACDSAADMQPASAGKICCPNSK